MGFSEITESFSTIGERTVNGIRDRYCRCGSNIMVRQFDPSVVPTGTWGELWLGFRWRVSSSYAHVTTSYAGTSFDPLYEYSTFEFGLCKTSGPVWGQSGSIDMSQQHSIGFRKSDYGGSGTTYWQFAQSGSYVAATGGGYMIHRVTGSIDTIYSTNFLTQRPMRPFINTADFTASYRNLFVLRFITASNADGMRVSYFGPDTTNSASMATDFPSASLFGNIMAQPTWNDATQSMKQWGFISYDQGQLMSVSQSLHGYFDGIYFSWRRLYDNMEISDIVLRTLP